VTLLQEASIAEEVYIAPSAAVIGEVTIKNKSSVTKSLQLW
jgi:carbonic anhydrase/acetyltransferase-like protein (isoleucine patch superfamily)